MDSMEPENSALPKPIVHHGREFSLVWIIPIITLVVGGWLVVKTLSEQGPRVTITFNSADGIVADKTRVKYRNVPIGTVESVRFSNDFQEIVAEVSFDYGTDELLKRGTRFWVVTPRISLRGASGLDTLVSGVYIELDPGLGDPVHDFKGLDQPPVITSGRVGKKVILIAQQLGSIDRGSPVYYQGIQAGEVTGYELANDYRSVYVHAFINAPYDDLVKANTRFWNVSGVDLSLGADGMEMRTASVQSLIYGGIAFDTLDEAEQAPVSTRSLVYTLHENLDTILEESFTRKARFVLYFGGSVRGLSMGAPVEFKGIKIGSVVDISLEFNFDGSDYLIPVLIEIEPERITAISGEGHAAEAAVLFERLVEQGLRAQLASGNLVTGQLYVALDIHPDTPAKRVNAHPNLPELPTIPGDMAAMTASVQGILGKLNQLDVARINHELVTLLENSNGMIRSLKLKQAVTELNKTMQGLQRVTARMEQARVEEVIASADDLLKKTGTTLQLMNSLLHPDSPVQSGAIRAIAELEEAARSARILMEMLERNPEALISGKGIRGE